MQSRIDDLVKRSGRSQRDVSTAAGLSPGAVNDILKNADRSPSVSTIQKLAGQLGVSVSYLIEGERPNRDVDGFSEPMVEPWAPPPSGGQRPDLKRDLTAIARELAPHARHPALFKLNFGLPDFGHLTGDILIVDLNRRAKDGDIVVATVTDLSTGAGSTIVRRLFSPYLISARLDEEQPVILADGARTVIMGIVCASFRAPDIENS